MSGDEQRCDLCGEQPNKSAARIAELEAALQGKVNEHQYELSQSIHCCETCWIEYVCNNGHKCSVCTLRNHIAKLEKQLKEALDLGSQALALIDTDTEVLQKALDFVKEQSG